MPFKTITTIPENRVVKGEKHEFLPPWMRQKLAEVDK